MRERGTQQNVAASTPPSVAPPKPPPLTVCDAQHAGSSLSPHRAPRASGREAKWVGAEPLRAPAEARRNHQQKRNS
jgi:cell division septation protein DedD